MAAGPFGIWPPGSVSGGGVLVPVGVSCIELGTGTEALGQQIGTVPMFTGITVNGPGDYTLAVNPAAGLDENLRFLFALGVQSSSARIVTALPVLPSGEFLIFVFDAAGAPASVGRVYVAGWYDTTPVPP